MQIHAIAKRAIQGALILLMTGSSLAATAATDDESVAELRAQVLALSERLAELESGQKVRETTYTAPKASGPVVSPSASWADNIKIKGDFRYRQESFDIEGREDRHRQRIRARTELVSSVSDTVTVGVGLATGSSDPISTNQTLGDGASSKDIVLDLAYATWKSPIEGLTVTGGKFKNPLHRVGGNSLLWDGDLRPEGLGVSYKKGGLFAHGVGLWLDESSGGSDALLIGGQAGLEQALNDGKLKAGLGYYQIGGIEGEPVFFDGDPRGNRTNPDGTYVSGFEMLEGFVEYSFALSESDVTVFADYVKNLDADDFDTGFALGIKGKQDKWQWGYTYQELEADAVYGLFTDSDFIGGGTDGEGHILKAGYALTKQVSLAGTLFLNDRNIDFGTEEDFKRLMLDISFKY